MSGRLWPVLLLISCVGWVQPAAARAASSAVVDETTATDDSATKSSAADHATTDDSTSDGSATDDSTSDDSATDESTSDDSDPDDEESGKPPALPNDPFETLSKQDFERSLAGALSDPSASFCHAKDLDPFGDPDVCSLSKVEIRQRCPGLKMACHLEPQAGRRWHIPAWLGSVADLTFWALLAALLAALAVAIWRTFGSARLEQQAQRQVVRAPSNEPLPVVRRVGDGDVARLWAEAERAASASRFEEAIAALQAALIHALRIAGKLHVSPALTNGDYLRALRPDPSLHGPVKDVFREVEAVQFGGALANAALYRKLFERVQPIVTRALSAFALLVLCASQSSCGSGPWGGEVHASAQSLGVFTRLMSDQHTTVRQRLRSLDQIEADVSSILVVGEQSSEAWSKLFEFASNGGTLIITSDSEDLEEITQTRYVRARYAGRLAWLPVAFEPAQLELSAVTEHTLELPPPRQAGDRTFATADARPYAAERGYGAGQLIFLGSENFLSSASLSVGDNAYFVASWLRQPGRVLELVGPWTGGGSKSAFSSLFKAGLGALVAQLGLFAVLFGWHGGVRFGSPQDPVTQSRRAFRDHVLALGSSYRRARATRFALATYGSWLIERLRDRLSPQQPIGLIELAGRVATRVDRPEAELVLLLTETRDAQDDAANAKPSALDLSTLEKLESVTLRAGGSK